MPETWFKPKRFGYGATPNTWQGWVATALFALAFIGLAALFAPRDATPDNYTGLILFYGCVAVLVVAFSLFARSKTDGEWRWRWGKKKAP
jgi:peptidoglycan/LPS O-acetylase OafA/YrhL